MTQDRATLVLLGTLQAPKTGPQADHMANMKRIKAECGHECIISPESERALQKDNLKTCCLRCIDRDAGMSGTDTALVEGGLDALSKSLSVTPEEASRITRQAIARAGGNYVEETS